MVNREQEVIDRVQIESVVNTEPLREVFSIEPYDESLMRGTENVFDIDTIGHQAQTTASGSLAAPVDEQESFDLFSKLQDEESMDALDSTKEPPADWEPGPEDEVDIMANAKWDDLHDGFGNAWSAARSSFRRLFQIAVTLMTVMKHSVA
jgi:RNA polymerase primary sigma factor